MNIRTFDDHIIIEYRDPYYSNDMLYARKLTVDEIMNYYTFHMEPFANIINCSIQEKKYILMFTGVPVNTTIFTGMYTLNIDATFECGNDIGKHFIPIRLDYVDVSSTSL
jgi:hypothetical protein